MERIVGHYNEFTVCDTKVSRFTISDGKGNVVAFHVAVNDGNAKVFFCTANSDLKVIQTADNVNV